MGYAGSKPRNVGKADATRCILTASRKCVEMHLRPGFSLGPRWGAYTALPGLPSWIWGEKGVEHGR